jgi:hypothetical protein
MQILADAAFRRQTKPTEAFIRRAEFSSPLVTTNRNRLACRGADTPRGVCEPLAHTSTSKTQFIEYGPNSRGAIKKPRRFGISGALEAQLYALSTRRRSDY